MVANIRLVNGGDRLNIQRAKDFVTPDCDDFFPLHAIASGIYVPVGPLFHPNKHPPPMRQLYKKVSTAVNKLIMFDLLWELDLAFILPTEVAVTIPDIHFHRYIGLPNGGRNQEEPFLMLRMKSLAL
jgi:hypothetical protein